LRDKYKLPGYPTIVFIKADGSEVDRIVGYRPADIFLSELERINRNEGTIDDLSHQLETYPEDDSLLMRIAEKYEERLDFEAALPYWKKILKLPSSNGDMARYRVATSNALITNQAGPLTSYIKEFPVGTHTANAYSSLQRFYRGAKDTVAEIQTFEQFIIFLEKQNKLTASDLNSYSWRMTQLEKNLEDALVKIRLAVKLAAIEPVDAQAGLMDTEAEVLWKLGRLDEAVVVIDECIELQPEDQYYKDQKVKFLKS